MVQAGAIIGVADIHSWPLAHCVEPAQHLDRLLVIDRIMAVGSAILVAGRVTADTVLVEFARLDGAGCRWVRHVVAVQIFSGQRGSGDKVPSCTDKNCACPRSGANNAASVPVSHAWLSRRTSESNNAARRLASRWATISSSSSSGGSPRIARCRAAWASRIAINNAFCSPVDANSAAIPFS